MKTEKTFNPHKEGLITRRKGFLARATYSPVTMKLGKINSRSKADTKNTN